MSWVLLGMIFPCIFGPWHFLGWWTLYNAMWILPVHRNFALEAHKTKVCVLWLLWSVSNRSTEFLYTNMKNKEWKILISFLTDEIHRYMWSFTLFLPICKIHYLAHCEKMHQKDFNFFKIKQVILLTVCAEC